MSDRQARVRGMTNQRIQCPSGSSTPIRSHVRCRNATTRRVPPLHLHRRGRRPRRHVCTVQTERMEYGTSVPSYVHACAQAPRKVTFGAITRDWRLRLRPTVPSTLGRLQSFSALPCIDIFDLFTSTECDSLPYQTCLHCLAIKSLWDLMPCSFTLRSSYARMIQGRLSRHLHSWRPR